MIHDAMVFLAGGAVSILAYRYLWFNTSWGQSWIAAQAAKVQDLKHQAQDKINSLKND